MKRLELSKGYFAKVDDQDYDRLVKYRWHVKNGRGFLYALRSVSVQGWCKTIPLHYEVLGLCFPLLGFTVDHRNGDGLDNQRGNLRLCTPSQNHYNRLPRKGARSKYKGVTLVRRKGGYRYQVYIIKDKKRNYLGTFDDEFTAMKVYNSWAIRLHGEFAYLNKWDGPTKKEEREAKSV
jgi:HNH endonuclease